LVKQHLPTIAIFGGSFDPPHRGHQDIVSKALRYLDIDKLVVVPAYLNPFKSSSLASSIQRLEWCHKLFDSIDGVEVDDYEIREGKSTTTSQSVRYLSQQYEVKYIIIGADNLESLSKWYDYEWLDETITWVVASRDGDYKYPKDSIVLDIDAPISSTQIREERDLKYIDSKIKKSVQQIIEGQK